MNGREQPYIDTNGTGTYEPTIWRDDVEGIQEGTPVDEQNLNNMETGIVAVNLLAEFLSEVVLKLQEDVRSIKGQVLVVDLTNNQEWPSNNSVQTVALEPAMDNLDYIVSPEIQGDVVNAGDIVIYDKQTNGFKVKYTGSASAVTVKLFVHGGKA